MLKENIKVFSLYLVLVILFILFKNGDIFDVGTIFRKWLGPKEAINSLLDPSDNLAEDYKNLLVVNNQLKTLADENRQLRDLLSLKKEKQYNLIVANVLSRDPVNRNIVLIDAGRDQNVKVGQAVVVNQGIIVGKVIDVGNDFSKIRLLTDNFSKLGVRVGSEYQVSGMLTGSLGLVMDLTYIPQEQEVKKNDLVVTADLDSNIPAGLVVGKIEEVIFSQEEVFKEASVAPLVNYDTLSILAIISPL